MLYVFIHPNTKIVLNIKCNPISTKYDIGSIYNICCDFKSNIIVTDEY